MSKTLDQLTAGLKQLDTVDAVWRQHNSFARNKNGELVAFSLSGSKVDSIVLDEKAAALEYLYLGGNEGLKEVVFSVPMPRLEHLNLSRCKELKSLKMPGGCLALRQVYLQGCGLEELEWGAGYPELKLLDASNNGFKKFVVPPVLSGLKYLYAGQNANLSELIIAPEIKTLEILHLRDNGLVAAPAHAILSNPLEAVYLSGNAPKNIPKVLLGRYMFNCLDDARAWFQELKDYPSDKNKAVKLMLSGNGNTGKSTLLCSLRNGKCDHDHQSTDGVVIETLVEPEITYNIWDFGGQEVYHGTHRLFISSEGLQIILFDSQTEELARKSEPVKDRTLDYLTYHLPKEYWYETTKGLSPDSQFFIVQNIKGNSGREDKDIRDYAYEKKADYICLNAKTGEDLDDLKHFLLKKARKLPNFEMLMPLSWLKVRQYFIDNVNQDQKQSIKLISLQDFEKMCVEHKVRENTRPLLLKYLHHGGFLYYHENLGGQIIADQRWALEAIYKPLTRAPEHYKEFKEELKGMIRVRRLFQDFGENYSREEKLLFLSFMESCGLCFRLNTSGDHEVSEGDVYVFPEFLPDDKHQSVINDWANIADEVKILRYRLPWVNYFLIQSFITALGRKTDSDKIWRNGIHVSTPEGWFKVELDLLQKSLLLFIVRKAMDKWLAPILDEFRLEKEHAAWEISSDNGATYQPFDLENWKRDQKEILTRGGAGDVPHENNQSLRYGLKNIHQSAPSVILLLAANPTSDRLSMRNEHSHIDEKLKDESLIGKYILIPLYGASLEMMNETIYKKSPSIIHFIGHGSDGRLCFHGDDKQGQELIDAVSLGKLFKRIKEDHPQLEIVLLNACHSEAHAKAISSNDIFTIGTTDKIFSKAARRFAAGFYWEYARTNDIRKAVRFGITQASPDENDMDSLIHLFHNGKPLSL